LWVAKLIEKHLGVGGRCEIRPIRDIEGLKPELDIEGLRNSGDVIVLEDVGVERKQPWAGDDVSPSVSRSEPILTFVEDRLLHGEALGLNVIVDVTWVDERRAARCVQTNRKIKWICIVLADAVPGDQRRKRKACLGG